MAKDNKHNALLSNLIIMQLMQNQNDCNQHAIHLQATVCMTMLVEYITFHINNPVKLVTLNHINLYTHNWYIYTQTQLYKFNISSPNKDPCVAISQ